MNNKDHVHAYGSWTPWSYYGSGRDIREQFCNSCPHSNDEQRAHQHSYGRAFADPYSPVGANTRIKVCADCDHVAPA